MNKKGIGKQLSFKEVEGFQKRGPYVLCRGGGKPYTISIVNILKGESFTKDLIVFRWYNDFRKCWSYEMNTRKKFMILIEKDRILRRILKGG